ncbi:MAG: response regulator transcription factor [Sphingobium sp.]
MLHEDMIERQDDTQLRIVIADDHVIFRVGLRLALEAHDTVGSIVEAGCFDELLALSEMSAPDVLILDLQMPGLAMPDGLKMLRRRFEKTPILILSASTDADDMILCLGAGAQGYVTKASDISILFKAIHMVRAGGIYVPADIVAERSQGIGVPSPTESSAIPRLTRRQAQVLDLVLEGHANKEIAYRLDMSEGTVKTHLASVMRLYNVNNRVQLLRQVERIGFRH